MVFSFGLVFYWRQRKSLPGVVILYSFLAYAGAIVLKSVVQGATAGAVQAAFGYSSVPDALYFGAQTAVFEVGLAFWLASTAANRKAISAKEAGGYGVSLAFWENGVLIGLFTMIDFIGIYYILGAAGSGAATVYNALVSSEPQLFYGTAQALSLSAYAILERVSSLLVHYSWGYLAVASAVSGRKKYFLVAFPMGFIDSLVVYEGYFGVAAFEGTVFALSLACLAATLYATRAWRSEAQAEGAAGPTDAEPPP